LLVRSRRSEPHGCRCGDLGCCASTACAMPPCCQTPCMHAPCMHHGRSACMHPHDILAPLTTHLTANPRRQHAPPALRPAPPEPRRHGARKGVPGARPHALLARRAGGAGGRRRAAAAGGRGRQPRADQRVQPWGGHHGGEPSGGSGCGGEGGSVVGLRRWAVLDLLLIEWRASLHSNPIHSNPILFTPLHSNPIHTTLNCHSTAPQRRPLVRPCSVHPQPGLSLRHPILEEAGGRCARVAGWDCGVNRLAALSRVRCASQPSAVHNQ